MKRASFDGPVQHAWDATSLTLASECARKYYYRMILNIAPRVESVHLLFGGLYATALEHFYQHRAAGLSIDEALHLVVRETLINSWNHERTPEGERIPGTGQPVNFDDSKKTRFTLIRSIVWYVEQFANESAEGITTYHLADGRAAVELSFAVEIADGITWCGHLDRVVNYGGDLYWMDQKTTGSTLGTYYYEGFRTSNQFMGYTWAGQIVLKSPVKGGIIDAAQIAAGYTNFGRSPIVFTRDQLDEWRDSAMTHIETTRRYAAEGKWPMNLTSCGNYGGCPYKILCTRAPVIRSKFIEGDFIHPEKPWDPLTPRG
jgi:hypothetical protein